MQTRINGGVLERVGSNFAWSIVSEAISKGILFFLNLYLARVLGVAQFGLFSLVQSVVLYVWLAVDLGTNMYGIKEISQNRENAAEIVSTFLGLRIFAGCTAYSILLVSVWLLPLPRETKLVYSGCGFYLLSYSFYSDWAFKGLEKFRFIAYGSFVTALATLVLMLLYVHGENDLVVSSWIWSSAYLLGGVLLSWHLIRGLGLQIKLTFAPRAWYKYLKDSIFFTMSGSIGMLNQYLPLFFLSSFVGTYEVGLFAAPYKIIFAACSLGFYIPLAFYPILAEQFKSNIKGYHEIVSKLRAIMLILGVIAGIIGWLLGAWLVRILLGPKYGITGDIFRILIWLIPLYFLRFSFGVPLGAVGGQKYHVLASVSTLVITITLGIPLILKWGLQGCAWIVVFAEVTMVVSIALFSRHFFSKINIVSQLSS